MSKRLQVIGSKPQTMILRQWLTFSKRKITIGSSFSDNLVLEKLLKACVVKQTLKNAPFTHDLTKLAKITGFNFSEEQLDDLDTITTFNLNARYDSFKKAFYRKCTYEFTKDWFNKIETLRLSIKEELMKQLRNILTRSDQNTILPRHFYSDRMQKVHSMKTVILILP